VRYRRLEREKLENGKMPKLRNTSQKRAESKPSGACCFMPPFALAATPAKTIIAVAHCNAALGVRVFKAPRLK
jgi:hypothetical protein